MPIKHHKPTSPGRRRSSGDGFTDITKASPEKKLTRTLFRASGRNHQGKITVRHRSGKKRRYRLIDFRQLRLDEPANVLSIEYDPNRSARIALIEYPDRIRSYILAADGMHVGQRIVSTNTNTEITQGNRLPLANIPTGMMVYNVELVPGRGGELVRSAGAGAMIMSQDEGFVHLKLSSGEIRKFPENCRASIGQVSNIDRDNIRWGKAGRMRHRGIRPTVRGKAMNPVDHPHGGGEGLQPIGLKHPKTPQGHPALGVKTREQFKDSNRYIISRRKKKK